MIVGPDGAPWITDGGLNAIVRVDPRTSARRALPAAREHRHANLNTAAFDRRGMLWFTGQSGIYGRLDPATGQMRGLRRAARRRPVRHHRRRRTATSTTPRWPAATSARIDRRTGAATVLEPPTRGQGARRVWSDSRGRIWVSEWNAGKVGLYDPRSGAWREWRLPGASPHAVRGLRRRARHRLAERLRRERDRAVRSGHARFTTLRLPSAGAEVRQLLGRRGEVWGAESGTDKLVVVRTG